MPPCNLEILLNLVGLGVDNAINGSIHRGGNTLFIQELIDFCNACQPKFLS